MSEAAASLGRDGISADMEDHSHDRTPLRSLIALSHISVPAFPLVWPQESLILQLFLDTCVHPKPAASDLADKAAPGREALRKWTSVAAIRNTAVKTQQAAVLLPKFLLLQPTA